ncbi:MAG TPA: isoprenylcysteine carboxylmethyltransferase family protein [Gemmatimonadaceae bacterium]|jgi:protein-S-isoprenylcysteine O-methyltransferase Ste14|nr:isoprenylcysteine carboxylmethyltransferase family protein [Gemmatimonadaceae bacterium]
MTLRSRALTGLTQFVLTLGALLFGSAWSLRYWQAWAFLAVFGASITAITLYLLRTDPALLERRMRAGPGAEKEKSQKAIQVVANIFFLALIVVPGLDHRFGWSHVSVPVVLAGDGLVLIGLCIVFLVFRENSYTSGIIEVAANQPVISTGPYRIIRHPMYAGAFVLVLGMPLALGSAWGLACSLPLMAAIVVRLIDEEHYLVRHLAGYAEYRERTRYRLIPGLY